MSHSLGYTNSLGTKFLFSASYYVIETSKNIFSYSITFIYSQITTDRILQISLMAISTIGLTFNFYNKNTFTGITFTSVLILQFTLFIKTHDHFFLTQKYNNLSIELEKKQVLSEQLLICTNKINNLSTALEKESAEKSSLIQKLQSSSICIQDMIKNLKYLEDKLFIIEETKMDITKVVDLLFQAKIENEHLKESLEQKSTSIEYHANRLAASSERIESELGKASNSFDLMQETAEKINLLSIKIDDLLKTTTTSQPS